VWPTKTVRKPQSQHGAKTAIEESLQTFVGQFGIAQMGPQFLKDWKDNKGVLRVNSKYVDHAKAALALVKEVNGQKATIQSVGVSGVVDKLRKTYL